MEKRGLTIGTYNTAEQLWTLAAWSFSAPEYHENFLDVPGRDGALDLSAALTNGAPTYHSRTLTVKLECSEGNRLTRAAAIHTMVNWLDGWRVDIVLPDDPDHYITGRVSVAKEYNDNAHAAVTVTAVCDPWRYAKDETVYTLTAATTENTAQMANAGRRTAVPLIVIAGDPLTAAEGTNPNYGLLMWDTSTHDGTQLGTVPQGSAFTVTGPPENKYVPIVYNGVECWVNGRYVVYTASVLLKYGEYSWSLGAGTYQLPDLTLPQGGGVLTYGGSGTLRISYREAVLR